MEGEILGLKGLSVMGLGCLQAVRRLSEFLNALWGKGFGVFLFLPVDKSMAEMLYCDQVVGIVPRKLNISRVSEACGCNNL